MKFALILTVIFMSALIFNEVAMAETVSVKRLDGSRISSEEIERQMTRLIGEARVMGLSVAVLNDSKIVYEKSFGLKNKEEYTALTPHTVVRALSLTKAMFGFFVMQLVEDGMIDLDVPIYKYLKKPLPDYEKYADLKGDERYKLITGRMLLNHTAGFPNSRSFTADNILRINFTPGARYSYSGEGINLLQFVIEEKTGRTLAEMMNEKIFKPFGMTRTDLTWNARFDDDFALGYDAEGKLIGHRKQGARAAGSMHTTLADYAKFIEAAMQGRGLKRKTFEQMIKPGIRIRSEYQFPVGSADISTDNDKIQLSYGLGWGVLHSPYGAGFFKEGHDDGWQNYTICFPAKKIAVLLMSNSDNAESIFKELLETLIKDTFTPWKWERYVPYAARQKDEGKGQK